MDSRIKRRKEIKDVMVSYRNEDINLNVACNNIEEIILENTFKDGCIHHERYVEDSRVNHFCGNPLNIKW